MKKYIIYFLSLVMSVVAVSCIDEIVREDEEGSVSENLVPMVFTASCGSEDTKTTIVDNVKVWWTPNDHILVNGQYFESSHTECVPTTTFEGEVEPADEYFALYGNGFWSGETYRIHVPYEQRLVKGDFPLMVTEYTSDPIHVSVAKCTSPSTMLNFSTLFGYIKFTITDESWDIRKITVSTIAGEGVAGIADIDFTADEISLKSVYEESRVVAESPEPLENGDYYIAMLPGKFSSGIKLKFESADGKKFMHTIARELELEAGTVQNIGTLDRFDEMSNQYDVERAALVAFYESTRGEQWENNLNWCTDKPVGEWYGVSTDEDGLVTSLSIHFNNLVGEIPADIYDLSNLEHLSILQSDMHKGNLSFPSIAEIGSFHMLRYVWFSQVQLPCDLKPFCAIPSLEGLKLLGCDIKGNIPPEIKNLQKLTDLEISYNNELTGPIPQEIGELSGLMSMDLCYNSLSGELPSNIGDMSGLAVLRLHNNMFTGTFPASLSKIMTNIRRYELYLGSNMFSGKIPAEIVNHPRFEEFWPKFLNQCPDPNGNTLDLSDTFIPAPTTTVTTMNGEVVSLKDYYSENELTILYVWASWCPYSQSYTTSLIPMYNAYKSKGLNVLGHVLASDWVSPMDTMEGVEDAISKLGIPWDNIAMYNLDFETPVNYIPGLFAIPGIPSIVVVNKEGRIIHHPFESYERGIIERLPEILEEYLGEAQLGSPELYESTDYSRDGEVVKLQSATKGDGIDVVLMGDAFVDKDMAAGGVYETVMNKAMEALFVEEPMKSFRECFNVYAVKAVSKHNVISSNTETALKTWFGQGTHVGGDDARCFEYASEVQDIDMTESIIICIMNQKFYAGTCYMYEDDSNVSYFPLGYDDAMFSQLLNHEAVGHGFGKLLDEYEDNLGYIPDTEIYYFNQKVNDFGWGFNVDVTSDPSSVQWSDFLGDSRYADEGLGVYEGALTYQYGAYRPSNNSIMRYNTGGFNAPSRFAIYNRIMEYSGATGYDYETFVDYDSINLRGGSPAKQKGQRYNYVEVPEDFEPLARPVFVDKTWREAMR